MSKADVERFVNDLKSDAGLLAEVKSKAAGVGSVVEIAKSHGYDISIAEAKDYIQSRTSTTLSDDQLEAVAGGKGGGGSTATSTNAVQTAEAATTVVEAAETVTTTVQDAEAATTVVAVAEAAVVLT